MSSLAILCNFLWKMIKLVLINKIIMNNNLFEKKTEISLKLCGCFFFYNIIRYIFGDIFVVEKYFSCHSKKKVCFHQIFLFFYDVLKKKD